MPGLFFHSAHIHGIARHARDQAITLQEQDPKVMPAEATTAILMAAISTEAFINELMEVVEIDSDSPLLISTPHSPRLLAFAKVLREIEESHGTLTLKYLMASQILSGVMFDKSSSPFQDFRLLVSVRNDIVHLKPKDKFADDPNVPLSVTPPKYIASMQQRGIARPQNPGVNMSWFNILQCDETARWACDSALRIIAAVLNFFPDGDFDPASPFKLAFSKWINE